MYIIDEIRCIYESSVPGSVDYAISEYLLTHLDTICDCTLSSIAYEAGIAKSALSKYIASLTKQNSFSAFCESLKLEEENAEIHKSRSAIRHEAKQFLEREKMYSKYGIEEVKQFVNDVRQAEDILIFSSEDYISCFSPFVHLCLLDHRKIRTQVYTRMSVEHAGNQDFILFIDPFHSPYEFQMMMGMDFPLANSMKAKYKYFAGRIDNRNKSMQVLTVQENTIFLVQKRLMQLCAEMVIAYTQ